MQSISVKKLHEQFRHFMVLDVREKWEWDIACIAGSVHVPLKDIHTKINELDQNHSIAVICHHGGRSARAAAFLLQHGFTIVYNVDGGIDAWAREIDPSVPLY
jgi:rhodanese-related sulfurtransferase